MGGLTFDSRRHLIWFWQPGKLEEVRRQYLNDPVFRFEANCQHLVHVEFGSETGFYLDALNLATRCRCNVMPIFAVTAQLMLRANWPTDTAVDCYTSYARQELICRSALDDLQAYLPQEIAEDIWTLTESGRQVLASVMAIEQVLADKSMAEPFIHQSLTRHLAAIGQLLPENPSPDLTRRYGVRRAVREWLGQVRSILTTTTLQARLGADCGHIIPAWFAPVIE